MLRPACISSRGGVTTGKLLSSGVVTDPELRPRLSYKEQGEYQSCRGEVKSGASASKFPRLDRC
jgi:hypothetical protein